MQRLGFYNPGRAVGMGHTGTWEVIVARRGCGSRVGNPPRSDILLTANIVRLLYEQMFGKLSFSCAWRRSWWGTPRTVLPAPGRARPMS